MRNLTLIELYLLCTKLIGFSDTVPYYSASPWVRELRLLCFESERKGKNCNFVDEKPDFDWTIFALYKANRFFRYCPLLQCQSVGTWTEWSSCRLPPSKSSAVIVFFEKICLLSGNLEIMLVVISNNPLPYFWSLLVIADKTSRESRRSTSIIASRNYGKTSWVPLSWPSTGAWCTKVRIQGLKSIHNIGNLPPSLPH